MRTHLLYAFIIIAVAYTETFEVKHLADASCKKVQMASVQF